MDQSSPVKWLLGFVTIVGGVVGYVLRSWGGAIILGVGIGLLFLVLVRSFGPSSWREQLRSPSKGRDTGR
jgi:hypothetical protein